MLLLGTLPNINCAGLGIVLNRKDGSRVVRRWLSNTKESHKDGTDNHNKISW